MHKRATDKRVFYVGKGKCNRCSDLRNRNFHWNNIVKKHGFEIEIVGFNLSHEDACQFEIDTILEMKYFGFSLCNQTAGGEGKFGYLTPESTKIKISNANKGKILSEEHKKKISEAFKGRIVSAETRRKMSLNNAFRRPENIKKISEANKKPIVCSNGMKFDSATDAWKWASNEGLTKAHDGSSITAACTGRQITAFGFNWKYK